MRLITLLLLFIQRVISSRIGLGLIKSAGNPALLSMKIYYASFCFLLLSGCPLSELVGVRMATNDVSDYSFTFYIDYHQFPADFEGRTEAVNRTSKYAHK